jgi:hypothetical protein
MGVERNDSPKPLKNDDKRTAIELKYILALTYSVLCHSFKIYILSEPFCNFFIEFLYNWSCSSAVHGRMGGLRNKSRKPFKNDDKGTAIQLKF